MAALPPAPLPSPLLRRRLPVLAGLGVALALALYYPVGAWRAHVIDDNPKFDAGAVQSGGSRAVAQAAGLIRREIDAHGWTPNKPFFMPASILTAMPSYQKGVMSGVGRFAIIISGQDADLQRAAELLKYPPTVWMIDPAAPWANTLSAEKQYRNAARAFEAFNQRLAAGKATWERRGEALAVLLDGLGADLDELAASLDDALAGSSGWFDRRGEKVYYAGKGHAYALLLVLTALGEDFAPVLAENGLTDAWQAMLASLVPAATAAPLMVQAGAADALLLPNHPAIQGFHLLRARSRMAAVATVLRR
ncbi:MAG TPA: DUF2333 domain-containing protein [Rhodospirillaceae bacterium]|nr:DUF2333 domain-containing protein [Rhodospirillaceae bacterium]